MQYIYSECETSILQNTKSYGSQNNSLNESSLYGSFTVL